MKEYSGRVSPVISTLQIEHCTFQASRARPLSIRDDALVFRIRSTLDGDP
jgi:hypothetical protein